MKDIVLNFNSGFLQVAIIAIIVRSKVAIIAIIVWSKVAIIAIFVRSLKFPCLQLTSIVMDNTTPII